MAKRDSTRSIEFPDRKALPPFAALRAFDAFARCGGVRRAAQMLQLDHAVISRHLRALEAWTGCALVDRSRAGAILTQEGERYHRQIAAAIDGIAQATTDLMKRPDSRNLQIWCMPGFAYQWFMGRLEGFERDNPSLHIDMRPTDIGPDFARHEADVDIRYVADYAAAMPHSSLVRSIEIARPSVVPVASPAYLSALPPIRTPSDLLGHIKLHEEDFANWRAWFEAHGIDPTNALDGPRLWHAHLTIDAARRGRGIALANHFLATDDLRAGRLVEIGTGCDGFEAISLGSYNFLARADRWKSLPVQRCRNWLIALIKQDLES